MIRHFGKLHLKQVIIWYDALGSRRVGIDGFWNWFEEILHDSDADSSLWQYCIWVVIVFRFVRILLVQCSYVEDPAWREFQNTMILTHRSRHPSSLTWASCLCVSCFWSLAVEAPSYSSSSTKPSVHQRATRQLSRSDPFLFRTIISQDGPLDPK